MNNTDRNAGRFDQSLLASYQLPEPSADLEDRLMLRWRREKKLREDKKGNRFRLPLRWNLAAMAAVVAVGLCVFVFYRVPLDESRSIVTTQRLQITVGSRAQILAEKDTAIDYRLYSDGEVDVVQKKGEALYQVNPGGRFAVSTPHGDVLVTGTRFRVRVGEKTQVAVVSGTVRVENSHGGINLLAGEQAVVDLLWAPSFLGIGEPTSDLDKMFNSHSAQQESLRDNQVQSDPIEPPGELLLEGQVIDDNNLPVEGALVILNAGLEPRTTLSGKDGTFSFSGLNPYRVILTARHEETGQVSTELKHVLDATSAPAILRLHPGHSLELTVVAAESKRPIPGAEIVLYEVKERSATTDQEGKVIFCCFQGDRITVRAAGFASKTIYQPVFSTRPQELQLQVKLEKGVSVSGIVTDSLLHPLSGVRVYAHGPDSSPSNSDPDQDGVQTDEKGRFFFNALAPGSYLFEGAHPDFSPGWTKPFQVKKDNPLDPLQIILNPGGSIAGQVVDEQGAEVPLAGVFVSYELCGYPIPMDRTSGFKFFSDTLGRFVQKGVPCKPLQIYAQDSNQRTSKTQTLDLSGNCLREDLVLVIRSGGRIAGKLVNLAGEPLPEIEVTLVSDFTQGVELSRSDRVMRTVITDGGGNFEFVGLPDKPYRIHAGMRSQAFASMEIGHWKKVGIQDQNVLLTLGSLGTIRGKLRFADGSVPANVLASLDSLSINKESPASFRLKDGSFELRQVPSGAHSLLITGDEFVSHQISAIEVPENQTVDLGTIVLDPGRTLSGQVRDTSGNPLAKATLILGSRPLTRKDLEPYGPHRMFWDLGALGVRTAESDAQGRFRFSGLDSVRQVLSVYGPSPEDCGTSKVVAAGHRSMELSLRLKHCAQLFGVVYARGKPAAGMDVAIDLPGIEGIVVGTTTDDQGRYEFESLTPGLFRISAGSDDFNTFGPYARQTITLGEGQSSNLDLEIPFGENQLHIGLQYKQRPVKSALVFLLASGQMPKNYGELHQLGYYAMSKLMPGTGVAKFDNLRPGSYTLCIHHGSQENPTLEESIQTVGRPQTLPLLCQSIVVDPLPIDQTKTFNMGE